MDKPQKVSENVWIIDKFCQDHVNDGRFKYAYAVRVKGDRLIWIVDGQSSESMYNEKYESLDECYQTYKLIFYGEDRKK